MPSLKDIRRRIGSVKNTQKITRAMKLVAAAKFARANAAVVAARPYGVAFDAMVARLLAGADEDLHSPLLESRPERKVLVVVLATDRGFCGGLNSNLFRQTVLFINGKKPEKGAEFVVMPWGRRAKLFSTKQGYKTHSPRERVLEKPTYAQAQELTSELIDRFTQDGFDRVYIAYVEFKSALSQAPKFQQVLPIPTAEMPGTKKDGEGDTAPVQIAPMVLVEPKLADLLDGLLRRKVASLIFRALLEGSASEHGARMTAMDSATNNANEVLRRMKIEYNRARQAAITKELIEITSGAQAL